MFYRTDFPHPQPSFPFSVPLVTVEPSAEPLVCVKFNAAYLPYVLGCLMQLELQATWNTDDETALDEMIQRINDLIYIFQRSRNGCKQPDVHSYEEVNDMASIRIDCDCNVFVLCCDGTEVQLAKMTDISPKETPEGNAPQPPKNGGQQKYCQHFNASEKFLIPTLVNTDDVIDLVSASGAGNDGTNALWRCVDGKQFFDGICVPSTTTSGSDPLPSTNHMALILNIGGTFYPFVSGTVTVPSGVSNAQAFIQVNDDVLYGNSGSYDVCVQVTNNQPSTWSHDLDFTISPYGFSPETSFSHPALWSPGVGWQADPAFNPLVGDIKASFASTTILHIEYYVTAITPSPSGSASEWYMPVPTPYPSTRIDPLVTGVNHITGVGSVTGTLLQFSMIDSTNTGNALTRLIISGTGVDPFPGAP